MRTSLSSDQAASLRRMLIYARWLYEKGAAECERPDELSHIVAITHFHNAVEIVLANILVYRGWAKKAKLRALRFEGMIDEIDTRAREAGEIASVPGKTEVIRLAEMRNNVIHHGQRFHRSESEWARGVCRRFLADAVRSFLDEDIERLAMCDLLENAYVRLLLGEVRVLSSAPRP